MDFYSGRLITAGSTNDTTLNLVTLIPGGVAPFVCEIEVMTGTVKFASGEDASSNLGRTSSSGKFHMFHSPSAPLHFDAADAADTFVITVLG